MIFSSPLCPTCKTLMHGPKFEEKHRHPERLVHAGGNDVARADCYYQCPKCSGKVVFDPQWSENTRPAGGPVETEGGGRDEPLAKKQ